MSNSKANYDQLVINYLSERGYNKAIDEIINKQKQNIMSNNYHSNDVQTNNFNDSLLVHGLSKTDVSKYYDEYTIFHAWAHESLEIVRNELISLCFPLFVHIYLLILKHPGDTLAFSNKFWDDWSNEHRLLYFEELTSLTIASVATVIEDDDNNNNFAQLVLKSKFTVHISDFAYNLLSIFLTTHDAQIITLILSERIEFTGFTYNVYPNINRIHLKDLAEDSSNLKLTEVKLGVPGKTPDILTNSLYQSFDNYFQSSLPNTKDELYSAWIDKFIRPRAFSTNPNPKYFKSIDSSLECTSSEPNVVFATITNSYEGMTSMNISSDLTTIACGFSDSCLRIYNLNKNTNSTENVTHEINEVYPKKSKRNYVNISTSNENTSPNSNMIEYFGHSGPIYCVDQAPYDSKKLFITGSSDEYIRLWDNSPNILQCVCKFNIESPIWDVKFNPILGYYFAAACMDSSLQLYSIDKKVPLRIFMGHTSDVNSCTWHENNIYLGSCSDDKTCRLWDIRVNSNSCVRVFSSPNRLTNVTISSYGNLIAAGSDSLQSYVWDIGTGKSLALLESSKSCINSIAFSPNNQFVCTGNNNCSLDIFDLNNLKSSFQYLYSSNDSISVDKSKVVEVVIKPSHSYFSKYSPIYKVGYLSDSLLYAGGPFSLQHAAGVGALKETLNEATEKEAVNALGLSHPVPIV